MKKIYCVILLICALMSLQNGHAQEFDFFYLKHLSKEEYVKQIQQCSEDAFAEVGLNDFKTNYNGQSYDWFTSMVDKTITKHFPDVFLPNEHKLTKKVYYDIRFKRIRKNVYYYLSVYMDEALVGSTPFLLGVMDTSYAPSKIASSKKEIKKILEAAVNN